MESQKDKDTPKASKTLGPPTPGRDDHTTTGLNKDKTARNVDRPTLSVPRRARTASASSAGSAISSAPVTDSECEITQTGRTKTVTRTADERNLTELLQLIHATATKMAGAAAVQKNMNMTVKNGIKTILEAADAALSKRSGDTLRTLNTGYDSTATETETKEAETPRTKRKREATGNTPETSQKRTPRVDPPAPWQTVTKKKKKPTKSTNATNGTDTQNKEGKTRQAPKHWGTAVLVKPGQDTTYSDIVRKIRATVDPTKSHVQVTTLRKTKTGLCLLKIQANTDGRDDFKRALQEAVGDAASVKTATTNVQLEILDLDCATTKDDVAQALRRETGRDSEFGVHIFGPNRAEQYMAVCDLEPHEARGLLDRGRIAIGWVRCRLRRRLTVTKCYKCLGYGHTKRDCQNEDRTKCCRKCGQTGHYATDCKNRPACHLCSKAGHEGVGHLAGSGRCTVFRAALEECKRQEKQRTE